MDLNYVNMWNGLYTYSKTVQDQKTNSIKNLVRIQLEDNGNGHIYIPNLPFKSKTYNDVELNIKLDGDNHIYGSGKSDDITIDVGGILMYSGESDKVAVKLAVTVDKKDLIISGNPRGKKLLNNLSIKLSGVTQGLYPDVTPWIDDSGSGSEVYPWEDSGSGSEVYPGEDSGGGSEVYPEEDSGGGNIRPPLPPGPYRPDSEDMDSGGGNIIPPYIPSPNIYPPGSESETPEIPIPNIKPPPQVIPTKPTKPTNNLPSRPSRIPKNPSAKQIMNLVKKNLIPGQGSNLNECSVLFPYAYGGTNFNEGDHCCVGKPYKNKKTGKYECDSEGSCYGNNCGGNSEQCSSPPCTNNKNVAYGNECPFDYPYPMDSYIKQPNGSIKWGGPGSFCCAVDPGENNICPAGKKATCAIPKCYKNTSSFRYLKNEDSIICSQKISNLMQVTKNASNKVVTLENSSGIPISSKVGKIYDNKAIQYITFSTKKLSDYSTSLFINKYDDTTINNGFLKLTGGKVTIQIHKQFKNYIGNIKNKNLWLTPTVDNMTTCKDNGPLYPISDMNAFGRDFMWEWVQMGSQTIDDAFVAEYVASGPLTEDIVNAPMPYTIYQHTDENNNKNFYFYSKKKEPVQYNTIEQAKETCSGFASPNTMDIKVPSSAGTGRNVIPYFQQCGDKGSYNMYCYADSSRKDKVALCKGNSMVSINNGGYALPQPACPSTHPYPYDNGNSCSATNMGSNGTYLTEASTTAWNMNDGVSSVPCENPPCCPNYIGIGGQNFNEAYDFQGIRLCKVEDDSDGSLSNSCSPSHGTLMGSPPCSQPYILNSNIAPNVPPFKTINAKTVEECRKGCQDTEGCGVYTFSDNKCQLKHLVSLNSKYYPLNSSLSDYNVTPNGNETGGYVLKRPESTILNGNIPGGDLEKKVTSTTQACLNHCIRNEQCNSYIWEPNPNNKGNNGDCTLKKKDKLNTTFGGNGVGELLTDSDLAIRANRKLIHPNSSVQIASNIEGFQSAINDIKIKPNIEHLVNNKMYQQKLTNSVKKVSKTQLLNNCKNNPTNSNCFNFLKTNFPINNNKNTTSTTKIVYNTGNECPVSHPYAFENGNKCASDKPYADFYHDSQDIVNLIPGITSVNCPSPPCGDNMSGDISKITTTNTSISNIDGDNKYAFKLVQNCANDSDCAKLGLYRYTCTNTSPNPDKNKPGFCVRKPEVRFNKLLFNTPGFGTPLTFKGVYTNPDACKKECDKTKGSLGWCYDNRMGNNICQIFTSDNRINGPGTIEYDSNVVSSGLNLDADDDSTAKCRAANLGTSLPDNIIAVPSYDTQKGGCIRELGYNFKDGKSVNECQDGYSRNYNSKCQSYCGCNKGDGSHKTKCDYCCKIENGACQRQNPASTLNNCCINNPCPDDSKLYYNQTNNCYQCQNDNAKCTINTGNGQCGGQGYCPYEYIKVANTTSKGPKPGFMPGDTWEQKDGYSATFRSKYNIKLDKLDMIPTYQAQCDADNKCVGFLTSDKSNNPEHTAFITKKQLPLKKSSKDDHTWSMSWSNFYKKNKMQGPDQCINDASSCYKVPWEQCAQPICQGESINNSGISRNECTSGIHTTVCTSSKYTS